MTPYQVHKKDSVIFHLWQGQGETLQGKPRQVWTETHLSKGLSKGQVFCGAASFSLTTAPRARSLSPILHICLLVDGDTQRPHHGHLPEVGWLDSPVWLSAAFQPMPACANEILKFPFICKI